MGIFSPHEVPGIAMGPDGRRHPHGAAAGGFDPQHVCLAYIGFGPTGIAARHAYFPIPPDLQAFGAAEFAAVASTGDWATAPLRQEVNFENFTFGSQHLIVFYVDPAAAPARFDPANLVQFAEFSARGQARSRNNCFLNAEIRSWPGMEALVLENWFVDDNGHSIAPPLELYYTMNVHLLMRCAILGGGNGEHDLPIILDPDTGNGEGHEP